MAAWGGRLFGPDTPPAGIAAEVSLDVGAVQVRAPGAAPRRVAVTELALRYTGFNNSQFEIAWRDAAGAWACHLNDPGDIAALLAAWPRDLAPLPRGLGGPRRRAALSWMGIAIIIALPLTLLAAFAFSQDRVVDAIAARISPEVERQIGAITLAQVKAATRFVEEGPEALALASVARRLVVEGQTDYRFHLADDKVVNAFAVPGGDIVVNRGLLRATASPDELAGVLAHEIQHVALRHSLKGMIRSAGLTVLFTLIVGDPDVTLAGRAADRLLSLKFSRDAEREADEHGFSLLVQRGIDPHGMVRFFETLAKQDSSAPPALLSTHPASAEREAALAARLKALPKDCCKPLTLEGAWPPNATNAPL